MNHRKLGQWDDRKVARWVLVAAVVLVALNLIARSLPNYG